MAAKKRGISMKKSSEKSALSIAAAAGGEQSAGVISGKAINNRHGWHQRKKWQRKSLINESVAKGGVKQQTQQHGSVSWRKATAWQSKKRRWKQQRRNINEKRNNGVTGKKTKHIKNGRRRIASATANSIMLGMFCKRGMVYGMMINIDLGSVHQHGENLSI